MGDLYRLYATANRDGLDFRVVMMPQDFSHKLEHPFDVVYMKALYEDGYAKGRAGIAWLTSPPGL
jgi:hypothetical protein